MALRPGRTTRTKKRPYTRVSKRVPRKSYVVGVPAPKIHLFETGTKGEYDTILYMVSKQAVQIRSNALEAARIVATKFLNKKLGGNFFFKVLLYPHNVIREKPIATGAGADRYSRGMQLSFGKPSGMGARVNKNQKIMRLMVNKENLEVAKQALKKAGSKLSTPVRIEVEE